LLILHQGVRKAHFRTVDGAVAGSFDEGEERREVWIQDKRIQLVLYPRISSRLKGVCNTLFLWLTMMEAIASFAAVNIGCSLLKGRPEVDQRRVVVNMC
jgi:hypothetical protein